MKLVLSLVVVVGSLAGQALPDGAGKESFARVCGECHGLDLATNLRMSQASWQNTVDKMAARGASASVAEFEMIVGYLTKNFGPPAGPVAAVDAKVMPDGAGKQIILRECTACHLPDHFVKYRHTNEEWQAIVIRMGQRVRAASKDELDEVFKYLSINFPKVQDAGKLNVNKATAQEIEARLSLTAQEAAAVVDYRARHGEFREWGDMLAIYGVDGKKIQAARDRMSF